MLIGVLLTAVGVYGYVQAVPSTPAAPKSLTALIPAAFGAVLFLCGVVALMGNLRKHAMHAAAAVGLIGLVAALVRLVPLLTDWKDEKLLVVQCLSGMAILCGVFVILCVMSFINARRARRA